MMDTQSMCCNIFIFTNVTIHSFNFLLGNDSQVDLKKKCIQTLSSNRIARSSGKFMQQHHIPSAFQIIYRTLQ